MKIRNSRGASWIQSAGCFSKIGLRSRLINLKLPWSTSSIIFFKRLVKTGFLRAGIYEKQFWVSHESLGFSNPPKIRSDFSAPQKYNSVRISNPPKHDFFHPNLDFSTKNPDSPPKIYIFMFCENTGSKF